MLNKAILMGRLAADPELRQTPNGVSVTAFRIAVNRTYNRDLTDWIDIVAWRQQAEFVCKYFQKGSMIIVEGSIQTRNYEDKNGNKRTAVEVVADQVHFAESKNAQRSSSQNFPLPTEMNEPAKGTGFSVGNMDDYEELDTDDGDLPF
ncbi:single-stranded DNA-binding protein [Massiliimalia massiliensis]|uniref:single-stranded DNA-binding protein n=1 Tax=Massiliimalia massiliensis TaxID=1852384 RepID=UPI0009853775|nr:single-stranded DNA-binding protein [Massiliimalia massiliensis]